MYDNRKMADATWEVVDNTWAKKQTRDRYNMHRVDLLLRHPLLRMARPPASSGVLSQWHVLCETPGCMMAQTQKNLTTHKRMKCAAHTYGTFNGHLLLAEHLRRQAHRLTRVVVRSFKKKRRSEWYVKCENPGCVRDVCITEKQHEHRRFCRECSYVSDPAKSIKDHILHEQALACVVAYRVHTYASGRTLREPLMRCGEEHCQNLILFSSARFIRDGTNRRCKRCNAKTNRLRPYEAAYNYLVGSAAKRRIPVEITYEEFVILLRKSTACYYCASKLPIKEYSSRNSVRVSKTSIDRLDNDLGYTRDNTVTACACCNLTKFRWLHAEEMLVVAAMRNGMPEEAVRLAKAGIRSSRAHAKKLETINFACVRPRKLLP